MTGRLNLVHIIPCGAWSRRNHGRNIADDKTLAIIGKNVSPRRAHERSSDVSRRGECGLPVSRAVQQHFFFLDQQMSFYRRR
jgi:hypothetical protein